MRVQYHDPPKPDMINAEWRSPLCDEQGRLITVGGGAGGASTVDQGAAGTEDWKVVEANSEAIKTATLIGTGWFPSQMVRYAAIPPGGIDLTTAVPGKTCIAIMGSRTTTNGTVIVLRLKDNTGANTIDLNFGIGYTHYGQWGFISDTSSAGVVPFYALFV